MSENSGVGLHKFYSIYLETISYEITDICHNGTLLHKIHNNKMIYFMHKCMIC